MFLLSNSIFVIIIIIIIIIIKSVRLFCTQSRYLVICALTR